MMQRRDFLLGTALASGLPSAKAVNPLRSAAQGIGVNCFDLFYGPLVDERRIRKPAERMAELADANVPFVRFAASPFWPREWQAYTGQRSRYFRLMDAVFEAAAKKEVGLIPSLFFNPAAVPDKFGETVGAWAQGGSRTLDFAKVYVEDMLRRYGGGQQLCHWEFANEFNVNLDLRNQHHWWPKVNVEMGTPAARGPKDSISTGDFQASVAQFADWVRVLRPGDMVSTGADRPRPNAFKLSQGRNGMDTPEEFRKAICLANPIRGAVASMHLYPDSIKLYFDGKATAARLLTEAKAAAAQCGQSFFLGEFGVVAGAWGKDEHALFDEMLQAIEVAQVEAAALWVYDFHWQPEWSVTSTNERAWQLKAIGEYNARRAIARK
jgi:hypothetical protein